MNVSHQQFDREFCLIARWPQLTFTYNAFVSSGFHGLRIAGMLTVIFCLAIVLRIIENLQFSTQFGFNEFDSFQKDIIDFVTETFLLRIAAGL